MFGVLRPESPEQIPMSPETSPPPPRSMAPMPAGGQYSSREELLSHAKDWAAHQGYAIVIARSRFNRLWLKCDRGGRYENRRGLTPDQRKRKRGDSRLLGCPFRMVAIVRKDGIWKVTTENATHNHGPSEDLSMHPTLRRLTEGQIQLVNEMTDVGNSPAEIMEELKRRWPDIKVLTRDIYNARKKYKTQKELAEMAAGLPERQPYEDPNGSFSGPTPDGRWEWVRDGEEVTSKNKKRRRKAPPEHQNLDPQLQTPSSSRAQVFSAGDSASSEHNQLHYLQDLQLAAEQNRTAANAIDDEGATHTPACGRNPYDNAGDSPGFPNRANDGSPVPNPQLNLTNSNPLCPRASHPPPSRPAETAIMSAAAIQVDANNRTEQTISEALAAAPKAQSGQVLVARMERVEKDLREQRNMLTQILGAVQAMQGTQDAGS